jgi:hypothetical protein
LSVGAGVAWRTPIGSIPNPVSFGEGYREWLAPELSYYATSASMRSVRVAARWLATAGTGIALELHYSDAVPRFGGEQIPFAPQGDRRGWGVGVSVIR